jgi:hypothetical protein
MVGECVYAVLAASDADCPEMYTGCGDGLSVVASTFTSTASCSCVEPAAIPHPALRDFNQDLAMDLLWQNEFNGEIDAWFMNETGYLGSNSIKDQSSQTVISLSAPWAVVGSGDFNMDTRTDIVVENTSTGELDVWFLNGTDKIGSQSINDQASGRLITLAPGWYLGAIGDIDKDGMLDLVAHSPTTGETQVWFLNGTDRKAYHLIDNRTTQQPILVFGTDWQLATTADVNLDGFTDLVWQNVTTGEVQAWFMSGTDRFGYNLVKDHATQTVLKAPAPWFLKGAGDVNRDGFADFIWHNTETGETLAWFMTGTDLQLASDVHDRSGAAIFVAAPMVLTAE